MKENLTVSDSKTLFYEQFPYVTPSLYKRIVDEMLVELNLLNNQSEFQQNIYFCIGLTDTFHELTKGYKPEKHIDKLFDALCKSTNFDPKNVRELSSKALKDHHNKSSSEILSLIFENILPNQKIYYSRLLILGIFKVITLASDYKNEDDISKIKIISEITSKLKLPLERAQKDISFFKSSINKLEQAKILLEETISSEREKRKKN